MIAEQITVPDSSFEISIRKSIRLSGRYELTIQSDAKTHRTPKALRAKSS
jgi:hypothetical protein